MSVSQDAEEYKTQGDGVCCKEGLRHSFPFQAQDGVRKLGTRKIKSMRFLYQKFQESLCGNLQSQA